MPQPAQPEFSVNRKRFRNDFYSALLHIRMFHLSLISYTKKRKSVLFLTYFPDHFSAHFIRKTAVYFLTPPRISCSFFTPSNQGVQEPSKNSKLWETIVSIRTGIRYTGIRTGTQELKLIFYFCKIQIKKNEKQINPKNKNNKKF